MAYKHFQFEVTRTGVAIMTIDVAGQRMNTLSPLLWDEMSTLLGRVEDEPALRALVIASGKPKSFIAGADIRAIAGVKSAAEAEALCLQLQGMFGRLEALAEGRRKPVVAAIDGPCLGGGLELALACSARIVSDDAKTVLGLPEVKLGLLPGGGGTQRLPRLVGAVRALDMILTGKNVRVVPALKMGLVDEVVPASQLVLCAIARAEADQAAWAGRRRGPAELARALLPKGGARKLLEPAALKGLALEKNPLGLQVVFRKARQALRLQTHGNYPAPERALDVMRLGLVHGMKRGLAAEAEAFGQLAMTPEARALIGVFFAQDELKKDTGTASDAAVRPIKRLGIVGGGLMGSGIAAVSVAQAKLPTRIKETDAAGVGRATRAVRSFLDKQVVKKQRQPRQVLPTMGLLTGSASWAGFAGTDVIIEAVFEDVGLKRAVLQQAEQHARPDTIFASNTSCIRIAEIAAASKHPETVIGMHYFSPAEKMPLVEVITHAKTADWVTATCVALGRAQGKTVIVVRDGPGFYTTRILVPFVNEAAHLLQEGADLLAVDRALVQFGFPVGPITLMDEVGLDTGAKISHLMVDAFGARMAAPEAMQKIVDDKRHGRKNGRGFFLYDKGKKGAPDPSIYSFFGAQGSRKPIDVRAMQERVALQMVNEAVHCLADGVLRSPRDGDIGAIFGLGFPPFLGGPFRYVDQIGADTAVRRLDGLVERYGPRFAPAELLREHARNGRAFYSRSGEPCPTAAIGSGLTLGG